MIFFFWFCFIYTTFCQGNSQDQRTHNTDNKFFKCFIFVCDGHLGFLSCHEKRLTRVRDYFKIFHSPTPFYVNLINVLQKSCLTGLFHDYQTCLTWSIEVQTICFAISICYTYHSFRAHYNVCMYRIYVYLELA